MMQRPLAKPISVMIVDDSASVRRVLSEVIASDPQLEVMATAADPYIAVNRLRDAMPDVMVLDIEMPRMDGLTFLRKIMSQRPIPVVICSTQTQQGSTTMMDALKAGAVDIIEKPQVATVEALRDARMTICDTIKAAAHASVRGRRKAPPPTPAPIQERFDADVILPAMSESRARSVLARTPVTEPVILIGSSTGGTEALMEIALALPADTPPVLVVQHMPPGFTAAFARRLNESSAMTVKEAEDGDAARRGRMLIAPGGRHMLLQRRGNQYFVQIRDGECVSRHRPSVDVLFRSGAQCAGRNAIAAILTGMGDDGARGMKELRDMGARTIAQDEASCVVFGMPKEAIARGGVERVAPLGRVAAEIIAMTPRAQESGRWR